jgi:hypothetical protein
VLHLGGRLPSYSETLDLTGKAYQVQTLNRLLLTFINYRQKKFLWQNDNRKDIVVKSEPKKVVKIYVLCVFANDFLQV